MYKNQSEEVTRKNENEMEKQKGGKSEPNTQKLQSQKKFDLQKRTTPIAITIITGYSQENFIYVS